MTPPISIIGRIVHLRVFQSFFGRAIVFGLIIALLLLLTFFPERYRGSASLTPTDSNSLGLSGTLSQLGALTNVFGNQAAVEVALRAARSVYVRDRVIDDPVLAGRIDSGDRVALHRWLQKNMEIRSLRGGIIIFAVKDRDPALARDIVDAYVRATQDQLTLMSREQTEFKREVLIKLTTDAQVDLDAAQAAYDSYRLENGYVDPRASIGAVSSRISQLVSEIASRQIALNAARQTYTDDNIVIKRQLAEIRTLQEQLAEAQSVGNQNAQSVGVAVETSSQLFKLERNLTVARMLYDSYTRYLQGTAVEDLASTMSLRILEDPYVDTRRQINLPALVGALAFLLLWGAIEFYRLRPPIGSRLSYNARID